jgi:hypothetical protein
MEQLSGFGRELIFVGAMTDDPAYATLTNRLGPFPPSAYGNAIGGTSVRFGAGNKVNLFISGHLQEAIRPTWFGFIIEWDCVNLSRDDQAYWPSPGGLPIGPTGEYDITQFVSGGGQVNFSTPIVDTVANTGGWPNTDERQFTYEAVNLLSMTTPGALPTTWNGVVWPITAPAENATFRFIVQPGAYVFSVKDFLAIYALPGIST